ncbi:glycosyltransferase [Synechococcus sp. CS-1325]|uniref:glycosyltransferase n=1 Tax=unclassified Synechococcus TaxID=2626047 RepID=UPI000DB08AFF|nr:MULTISPECIES: glycosyltransferase [unclassified Synechococcus]MCT0198461.1 glycosyltransferase [Synechococcus sp. CS-1325]MCT0213581.1 glycosyltransferase [Synechococcus sp. CS-1326]MCT0232172.1 glycosyltransferase [Synechococcus sp. CS-1327]PZV01738.1 MAG: glycosyltransferase [Cyanobium sp.]
MRPLRFLVPGTTGRFRCGGLQVELQTALLTSELVSTELVTYRQREEGRPFLADLLCHEPAPGTALWIVSWGFDVPKLLGQLKGRPVAYHAHSSGYGFDLPAGVPVLAVSRNTLGYWGDRAPRNPLFLVPNALESQWLERGARHDLARRRPIDVLVQARKSSSYLLDQLVPALRQRGLQVEVQQGWVNDLVDLFNNAAVVLYDSADYWRGRGVSEGFGLPPLEAIACGCVVFSSLNHALADFIEPGVVGHQIGAGTLAGDLERIAAAVARPHSWQPVEARRAVLLAQSSEAESLCRWEQALTAIDAHWDRLLAGSPALRQPSQLQLRTSQALTRFSICFQRWRGRSVL